MEKEKINIIPTIVGMVIQIVTTLIVISVFALILNFAEIDYKYSPVFGSVATGIGAFTGALYLSSKKGSKGYLTGSIVGGITFLVITLIGLIMNDGGITINTLFHLIIILLSAITGGVIGVNKKGKKYI